MPEHLRALVVLMLIGLATHWLLAPLRAEQFPGAHARRRGVWFALTVAAFAFGNFWLFCGVALALLLWVRGREENLAALFLALLLLVPPVQHEIAGLGLVNFFFGLSFPRLAVLVLLVPLALRLASQPRPPGVGWARVADLMFLAYVVVELVLLAREPSVTSAARSLFYLFIDKVVPYYVFSRVFAHDVARLRDAAAALVVAGLVLAAVGVFESARHWLLYAALTQAWGSGDQLMYLGRSGVLRAMGSTGHSIALGLVMSICLLLYLPMRARMPPGWRRAALLALLSAGLFVPLSRGPWLGAAAGLLLYIVLGRRPLKGLLLLGTGALAMLVLLPLLPFGGFVLDLIPFFGSVEAGNISYRQRLMENAWIVIWRDPLLGSDTYLQQLADMGMTQGQGIVDIVNTYVQVALRSGLVGLAAFGGLLLSALMCALRGRKLSQRAGREVAADLGRSLAASQLAVIVTIASVSSILVIPWMYWCLTGLLVGYGRAVRAPAREPDAVAALRYV